MKKEKKHMIKKLINDLNLVGLMLDLDPKQRLGYNSRLNLIIGYEISDDNSHGGRIFYLNKDCKMWIGNLLGALSLMNKLEWKLLPNDPNLLIKINDIMLFDRSTIKLDFTL